MSRQPTKWPTSHLVFNLVRCFATAKYHKTVHLIYCFEFGQMLCYRQVPQNGPPQVLFSMWSNALLPPGDHKMVHLTFCFQFGQMLCYRQVTQHGPQKHTESTWFQNMSLCYEVFIEKQRFLSSKRHPHECRPHGLKKLPFWHAAAPIWDTGVCSYSNTKTTPPHILSPFGPHGFAHTAIPKPHPLRILFPFGPHGFAHIAITKNQTPSHLVSIWATWVCSYSNTKTTVSEQHTDPTMVVRTYSDVDISAKAQGIYHCV